MTGIRFCSRCVISNQRPTASREYARTDGFGVGHIPFDEEGVCGACRVAEAKANIDWNAREHELLELLSRYRRDDGRPDVLVPGSGGKDSVLAAHLLRNKYGMHPLTCTWAPHAYTEVGWRNFQAWLNSGFENLLVTPNPQVHRKLTRLAFQNLLHPFQPFVMGQRALAPRLAARYKIDLIVYGEDDSEYEGTKGWQERAHQYEHMESLTLAGVPYADLVGKHGFTRFDLDIYRPPAPRDLVGRKVIALGNYIRWQPQEAYYFAAEHGFEANDERTEGTYSKYNSIDDKLDPLHYYTTWVKWGLGRASYDAAQEIRNGHLTRQEGVDLVRKYDGEIRPTTVAWCCDYMGIAQEDFWATIAKFKREYPQVS